MSNKEKEFEVLDALQDMFYSMAERMSADHVWSAKELEDMGDILFSGERNRLSDYIDRLIKLTEIPEGFAIVPIDNWINCSDRLPDTDDEYLVAFTASHMDNLEAVRSDNFIKRLGKFFIHGGTVNVHHWKPLPQPPKPTDK